MNRRLSCRLSVFALLVAFGSAGPLQAQQLAQVTGSVHDHTGGALAGVVIVIRGAESQEFHTDSNGTFAAVDLPPGDYQLSAALSGFETAHRDVHIQPGAALMLSITLSVALLEQVVVAGAKTGNADVQAIPMAVSAVSSDVLARTATRTIEQAAALLPAVTFSQNSTFGQLSIRGIGTNLVNAGGDPSSAMYLDGVYLARPAMMSIDFLDLERVEVLRGPQGTLYGRNAVGGALNLVSRAPTNDVEASARVTGGSFDELRAEAQLSGPLKRDRILGRVAFARGTREGYVQDLDHPDHRLGGDDLTAARGQLRFLLGHGTDLLFSTDLSDQDGIPLTFNKVLEVKPGFRVDNPPDLHDVRASTLASAKVLQQGASARLSTALTPSTTLVSLTAFRRLDNEYLVDADITELPLLAAHVRELQHQWSEEVTITHRRPRLSWIAGAFLFDEENDETIEADQLQTAIRTFLDPRVDAGSAAGFGQTTFEVTPTLSGTVGLRYTRERKTIENAGGRYTLDAPPSLVPGSGYAYVDSILHTAWTPKFGVEWRLPRQAMIYGSATKGFKSGGFNPSSTQPGRGFAPEWAWSYEGGVKTMLGRRARLNVAAFTMDYTNLQVQTPIGIGVFDIRNAAAATIRGVELEGATHVGRGLEAGGHVTWLNATYDQYLAVAPGGVTGDVAGNRLNNAPEWAGRLWAEWNGRPGRSDLLTLTVDATAQSTVFYTPFNDAIQRQLPYALIGARAEYGPSHRRWSVNAYVRNLMGTDYIMATFATSPAAFGGRPGASRQLGLQLVLQR